MKRNKYQRAAFGRTVRLNGVEMQSPIVIFSAFANTQRHIATDWRGFLNDHAAQVEVWPKAEGFLLVFGQTNHML
jgi:hypothetical protein